MRRPAGGQGYGWRRPIAGPASHLAVRGLQKSFPVRKPDPRQHDVFSRVALRELFEQQKNQSVQMSPPNSGPGGRGFKSSFPDHYCQSFTSLGSGAPGIGPGGLASEAAKTLVILRVAGCGHRHQIICRWVPANVRNGWRDGRTNCRTRHAPISSRPEPVAVTRSSALKRHETAMRAAECTPRRQWGFKFR